MNVGQILETHLGWASAGLGRQIGEMVEKARGDGKAQGVENMRKLLKKIYGEKGYKERSPICRTTTIAALAQT